MPVRGVLIDLAGVLYDGDSAIPGAHDAIAGLRAEGYPVRFITNTTRKNRETIHADLGRIGFEIRDSELFTPVEAARNWLEAHGCAPHLLVHPAIKGSFADLDRSSPLAVVVGDAGQRFTYDNLNIAFRKLTDGAPLVALAKNRVFKDADGQLSLDAGAFVTALEYASRREAVVLGKPSIEFFANACADMGVSPGEAVMIGDDAESDIAGARLAGVGHALLVRTGKYNSGDEHRYEPGPTATVADLRAAVDWITGHDH